MKHTSIRHRRLLAGMASVSIGLSLGAGAVMAAPAADETPAVDAAEARPHSRAVFPREHKHHKLSLGTVAPAQHVSRPQEAVVVIKSAEEKKLEIEKRGRK